MKSALRPRCELLRLRGAGDAELRALARAHPGASGAAYISRSYCESVALVAWHGAPVGVDIERIAPCGSGFGESICTPGETALYADRLEDDRFVTSLWASKEALAKALGDPLAHDPRRLESPLAWPDGAAGQWRVDEFTPAPGLVAWLVWAVAPQNSASSAASADSRRRAAGRR